jgi:3-oxoacyl-[acyl-carrier protein] reductase
VRPGSPPLEGRTALVTGGAVGIGLGICAGLARSGADVAFTYHRHGHDEASVAIEAAGRSSHPLSVDVTAPSEVNRMVDRATVALGGRINILVNNAGGLIDRVSVAEMSDEHWRRVIDVNLSSAFYCSRAAIPVLPDGHGRIVNVSSLAAFDGGGPGAAAYAAAKAGMVALTRGLAKELAARAITVNAVAPGLILATPFHDTFSTPEMKEAAVERTPLHRGGTVNDVAGAVVYLASDAASFVTGEVIHVNGGLWFA